MAKKRGKKRPLVGAAKASHEARLRGGKKVSVARESEIRAKYQPRLDALKKMQLSSLNRITKAREIMAERDRELAGLPPKSGPEPQPISRSFIGQPGKEE